MGRANVARQFDVDDTDEVVDIDRTGAHEGGDVVFPRRIYDPFVERALASGDLRLLRELERELQRRYRHEYDTGDPRRKRYDERIARVRHMIDRLELGLDS